MFLHPLACLLVAASAHAPAPQDVSPLPEVAAATTSPLLREEFFELTLDREDTARGRVAATTVGVLAWRCRSGPDAQLEWDLSMPLDGGRLLEVEPQTPTGPQMIWRELRPGAGRSLTVNWDDDGQTLNTLEWGREETVRRRIPAPEGSVLPLFLLEQMRRGDAGHGRFLVFDPLSLALEPVELSTRIFTVAPGGSKRAMGPTVQAALLSFELRREITLKRDDGTLAGEYLFRGNELLSFRWQTGGISGRRIAESEYSERIGELQRAARSD